MFYLVLNLFGGFKASSINASLGLTITKMVLTITKMVLTITKMVLTITKMVPNYNKNGFNYNKNGLSITFLVPTITKKIFCYSWRFVIMNLKGRRIPYVHNKSNQN
jgi:hypothetical protein